MMVRSHSETKHTMTKRIPVTRDWIIKFREVDKKTGCWLWTRCVNYGGYGQIGVSGLGTSFVHRVAFELWNGPFDSALCVLHRCDNPRCFNPDHLFLGTKLDNARDMIAKNRVGSLRRLNAAKITAESVIRIREMAKLGVTQSFLAKKYGLCQSAVSRIITKSNWRNVIS